MEARKKAVAAESAVSKAEKEASKLNSKLE